MRVTVTRSKHPRDRQTWTFAVLDRSNGFDVLLDQYRREEKGPRARIYNVLAAWDRIYSRKSTIDRERVEIPDDVVEQALAEVRKAVVYRPPSPR